MTRILLLLALLAAPLAHANPPNIVLILIDDMGWPDLGCYGHAFHETPNIDKLASEGARFTDAYAACPVCSPTRASIIAGQYPARVGITDFITGHWRPYERLRVPINETQYLPLEVETIAEALKAAGYTTGMFGKWHLGGREHFPDKQGFDEVLVQAGGGHFGTRTYPETERDKEAYLADTLTEHATDFMKRHKDAPFFVFLSHYAVHIPLQAKQELIAKYEAKPKPEHGINNPIYAAMVEHVDQSVGAIMMALDELGEADDTLIVFYSDNGGLRERFDKSTGVIVSTNAPLRDEKGTLYEGGIRVPFIVRWPGKVSPGAELNEPVSSVDLYPTLVAAAGATPPEGHTLDGTNLVPLLTGDGKPQREAIYWHYPHYHHSDPAGAIRAGQWKLIERFEDGALELYDLSKDIAESDNLSEDHPEIAADLQQKLAAWRTSVDAELPTPNPDHDPERAHEWGKHPDRK